jgi:hypothetical protein
MRPAEQLVRMIARVAEYGYSGSMNDISFQNAQGFTISDGVLSRPSFQDPLFSHALFLLLPLGR